MQTQDFVFEMTATSSIFGRNNVSVQFSGDGAWTNLDTINLPALDFNRDLTHDTVLAWRGYVDHEAGHQRHSDMPMIMDFYKRCHHNNKAALKDLHNSIEDIWEEKRVMRDYPGSRKNLRGLSERTAPKELESLRKAKEEGKELATQVNPVTASLAITALGRLHINNGADCLNDIVDELPEELIPHAERWVQEIDNCNSTEDTITLAKSIWKWLEEENPEESKPENFDPQGGKDMEVGDLPDEMSEEDKKQLQELAEEILKDAKEILFGKEGHEEERKELEEACGFKEPEGDDVPGWKILSTAEDEVFSRKSTNKRGCIAGWGSHEGNFLDWQNKVDIYEQRKGELQSHVNVMRAKIKRGLMAYQRRDWEYNKEHGKLDGRRLVSAVGGAPNVFKRQKDRDDVDTAVLFMNDLSGSMHGDKAEVAAKSSIAFAECLEGSGINYAISGFCNASDIRSVTPGNDEYYHRTEQLNIYKFKDFNDSLRTSRGWVGNIDKFVGCNNSDPDAIYWSYYQLASRPERRKVLVVLSDGQPACHTYRVNGDSLRRATEESVRFVERKGIQTVGIGIKSNAVEQFYKEHIVVNNLNDLSGAVFMKLTKLLLDGKMKI